MAEVLTNRKPPDELADVRERIKELQGREGELRTALIEGSDEDRIGDDFIASVTTVLSERVNSTKLRREKGAEFLAPYMTTVESTVVKVERLKGEEEV